MITQMLDLAAGPGEPSCYLAAAFPSARVLCTDVSEDMVPKAAARAQKKGLANVTCAVVDAHDLSSIASASQVRTHACPHARA